MFLPRIKLQIDYLSIKRYFATISAVRFSFRSFNFKSVVELVGKVPAIVEDMLIFV